jgi:glycyl-tRNA synthetase
LANEEDVVAVLQKWAAGDGKKLAPNLALVQRPEVILKLWKSRRSNYRFVQSAFGELLDGIACAPDGTPHNPCPNCGGQMSEPRPASLMLETFLGPVQETATKTYLRPETAQGIFVNFDNVLQASRKKLPFGIAQIGKSFRNEITPGNFTFRTREFEQMEIEFFCMPGTDEEWHQRWIDERFAWYQKYGIRKENIRLREHEKDELAFYAKRCVDVEYLFPMGWSELEGIANRTDYDLKQHSNFSGKALEYFDEENRQKLFPYVIEPSAGADRSVLAFIVDAYHEEEVRGEKRVVLNFHRELAPLKIAVLPLLKKNPRIVETAQRICADLRTRWYSVYDDTASIGRLYRRQDEVGTPFCITVDVQTVGDEKAPADDQVTIRDRNTMDQVRVPLAGLRAVMDKLMAGQWSEIYAQHAVTKE